MRVAQVANTAPGSWARTTTMPAARTAPVRRCSSSSPRTWSSTWSTSGCQPPGTRHRPVEAEAVDDLERRIGPSEGQSHVHGRLDVGALDRESLGGVARQAAAARLAGGAQGPDQIEAPADEAVRDLVLGGGIEEAALGVLAHRLEHAVPAGAVVREEGGVDQLGQHDELVQLADHRGGRGEREASGEHAESLHRRRARRADIRQATRPGRCPGGADRRRARRPAAG